MDELEILNKSEDLTEINKLMTELIRRYSRLMYYIAYQITKNEENSKDLEFIPFEELFIRRKECKCIKGFLTSTVTFRALTSLRNNLVVVDFDYEISDECEDVKKYVEHILLFTFVKNNLSKLEFEVFIEVYLRQLSLIECANKLNLSYAKIKRTNKKLLEAIKDHFKNLK